MQKLQTVAALVAVLVLLGIAGLGAVGFAILIYVAQSLMRGGQAD